MNIEDIKKAYQEGKAIQYRWYDFGFGEWHDLFVPDGFNFDTKGSIEYRIKRYDDGAWIPVSDREVVMPSKSSQILVYDGMSRKCMVMKVLNFLEVVDKPYNTIKYWKKIDLPE